MKRDDKQKNVFPVDKIMHSDKILMISEGRNKRARIEGVKKLLLCIESEVKMSRRGELVVFEGRELCCTTYASGAVEVYGEISALRFSPRSEGGEVR